MAQKGGHHHGGGHHGISKGFRKATRTFNHASHTISHQANHLGNSINHSANHMGSGIHHASSGLKHQVNSWGVQKKLDHFGNDVSKGFRSMTYDISRGLANANINPTDLEVHNRNKYGLNLLSHLITYSLTHFTHVLIRVSIRHSHYKTVS